MESCKFRWSFELNPFQNQTKCRDVWVLYISHSLTHIYLSFFHFQAILHFVNQKMSTMGLQVVDMDKQVKWIKTAKPCEEPPRGEWDTNEWWLPPRLYHLLWIGSSVTLSSVQFADGVILLMLIGQLEGFFIPLHDFILTPITSSEMVQYGSAGVPSCISDGRVSSERRWVDGDTVCSWAFELLEKGLPPSGIHAVSEVTPDTAASERAR